MQLELSAEHEAFRDSVRRFMSDRSPIGEVRRVMETDLGHDPDVWARMTGLLGLPGLIVPEEYGGSGLGFVELSIVLEETGRALLCAPYLGTVLATIAILNCGDNAARKQFLRRIAGGTPAALALADDSGEWPPADSVSARRDGSGVVLEGHRAYVVSGAAAELIVVVATTADGWGLFVVDGAAPGLSRTAQPVLDQTRRLARLDFASTPATPLGVAGETVLPRILDLAGVALAAEQVGGARRCLEMSVEYAKTRRQFGRLIGSFQAVKHRCADMLFGVEAATSGVRYAATCAANGADELDTVAPLVRAYCSDVYTEVAADNLQLHGGIGFTWEADPHLYLKRAKSSELLLGGPAYHRELLAQRAGF